MLTKPQRLLVALGTLELRRASARELALALGASDLMMFVEDDEIGVLVPAPGFAQTLTNGRRWRAFLETTVECGHHEDTFAIVDGAEPVKIAGFIAPDRSVLALIGGEPRGEDVEDVIRLLPLLTRSLRSEQASVAAAGRAEAARTAAAQAQSLGEKLSVTRVELQRALRAAEEAARAKDDFLAVVSHELRTPLNGILGWSQLLSMGTLDDAAQARALAAIERNAKAQARLIEDILDLSRVASGRLRLNVESLALRSLIDDALDVVRPAAVAKRIRIETTIDSHTGMISGDGDRLQQVLWNVLSNAVTYSDTGGRIEVIVRRVKSNVEIAVVDCGHGIAAEFLPYLFDRFRQADNSATRRHGGLGLGLSIARHLVEMHGGTIRAESAGPGKGSTFTIRLPLATRPSSEPVHERPQVVYDESDPRHPPLQALNGLRVLVVDDEADARDMLTTALRQSGAVVTAARSVAEALECVAVMLPDVIVSDIEMPGEDGYSLIQKIRARGGTDNSGSIPAIALTAYAGPGDRMRALEAGFQRHMAKPVEPAELLRVVASLTHRALA